MIDLFLPRHTNDCSSQQSFRASERRSLGRAQSACWSTRTLRLQEGLSPVLAAGLVLLAGCATSPPIFNPKTDRVFIEQRSAPPVAPLPPESYMPSAESLNFTEAARLALKNNPHLQSFGSSIDVAAAKVIQARLWPNPSLNIGTEDGRGTDLRGYGFGAGLGALGKITGGLSQVLPITGIVGARTRAAEAKKGLALLRYERELRSLLGALRRAYYSALLAQRLVKISDSNSALALQLQKRADDRVRSGAASSTEAFRAEIEVAESESARRSAQVTLERARQSLFTFLGNPSLNPKRIGGEIPKSFPDLESDWLRNLVASSHPAIALAESGIKLAKAQIEVAEKAWLPQPEISLSGGRTREGSRTFSLLEWGLSIPLPLLNRGEGNIAARRAGLRKARQSAQAVRNQLLGRLRVALQLYETQRAQVRGYEERILPLSQKTLALVQRQQQLGKLSQIDVLDAQRTVFRAKRTYLGLLQGLLSTCVEIEVLGGLPLENFAAK